MHLYRLMTHVRAGDNHIGCVAGQAGIATIWVRADCEKAARGRGEEILARRQYQSYGELRLYQEEVADDRSSSSAELAAAERDTVSGYSEIKNAALDGGDGLFEAWFPS